MHYTLAKNALIATAILAAGMEMPRAADLRDESNIHTGKVEFVVPDAAPGKVAEQIKDILSGWSIRANANLRSLPSPIPARPEAPQAVQRYLNGNPVVSYQCPTAYGEITRRPPATQNAFVSETEITQACLYAFSRGVKVYLIYTFLKRNESLTSGLFNGIAKAIRGSDTDWISKQLSEYVESFRKGIPNILVERIEVPGFEVREPDKAAVAALYPVSQPVVSTQSVQQALQMPASPASTPVHSKLEARKNLTAMGLTYYSQDQLISAIQRKDDLAVSLFIDAGGVDLAARDKHGKTPMDYARELGAAEIIAKLDATTSPASPVTTPASGNPVIAQGDAQYSAPAVGSSLPPDVVAKLNSQLDAMNLPPEKKEAFRLKLLQQAEQLNMLNNRAKQGETPQ